MATLRRMTVALLLASTTALPQPSWLPETLPEWTCAYEGDLLPGDAVPVWHGHEGQDTEATVAAGILRVTDTTQTSGSIRSFRRSWNVDPDRGGVVEARIRVVDNNAFGGVMLMAADGVHECFLTVYPDRIVVNENGPEHVMDTTDAFHVYRVVFRETDVYVWVDDEPVIDGAGSNTRPAHAHRNCLSFGSGASRAVSDAYYDYVRYALFGQQDKPDTLAGVEHVIVYKKKDVYACFPSLVQMDDGTLYTSFGTRTRRSHIDPTGGSARFISRDSGHTWHPAPVHFRVVGPALRCGNGLLVEARAYGWREVAAERRAEFEEQDITVRDVRPGIIAYLQGAYVRRSSDNGQTWEHEELELPPHNSLMNFNASQRLRTSDGVLLAAPYGRLKGETLSRVYVFRSEDDGDTWTVNTLASDPNGEVALNETALGENSRGETIALMRSEPPAGGYLYQSVSGDAGKTWTPARRTPIWGYPANLLRMADGRMICTYGYRRGGMGVRAALSEDGGHTWDTENEFVLRADGDGHGSDLGYPVTVETAPGTLFTLYYMTTEDGITHIAGTHWSIPE